MLIRDAYKGMNSSNAPQRRVAEFGEISIHGRLLVGCQTHFLQTPTVSLISRPYTAYFWHHSLMSVGHVPSTSRSALGRSVPATTPIYAAIRTSATSRNGHSISFLPDALVCSTFETLCLSWLAQGTRGWHYDG